MINLSISLSFSRKMKKKLFIGQLRIIHQSPFRKAKKLETKKNVENAQIDNLSFPHTHTTNIEGEINIMDVKSWVLGVFAIITYGKKEATFNLDTNVCSMLF